VNTLRTYVTDPSVLARKLVETNVLYDYYNIARVLQGDLEQSPKIKHLGEPAAYFPLSSAPMASSETSISQTHLRLPGARCLHLPPTLVASLCYCCCCCLSESFWPARHAEVGD
jgi:hypothetical protein